MTNVIIGGEVLNATPEQLEKVKAIFASEQPWVPKMEEEYWSIDNDGRARSFHWDDDNTDAKRLAQNNVFPTEEAAKRQARRNEGATRRYLPKKGQTYKTFEGGVICITWNGVNEDWTLYHTGQVWIPNTPDAEIQAWYEKYGSAWMQK